MIDLAEVGVKGWSDGGVWRLRFGVYLPGITPSKGYRLLARVVHERDQFDLAVSPADFELVWQPETAYDLWHAEALLTPDPSSHFGQPGRYLYRYQLLKDGGEASGAFADPFARESGPGTLSAFTVGAAATFSWTDADFRAPEIDRLVVYELNVREFARDFLGLKDRLDYLTGLGVNALELMPVTTIKEDVDWGYTPLGYFAPDDRLGGVEAFKALVDACHAWGIAVILDAVYAHAHPEFAYSEVYRLAGEPSPMMGAFAGEFFHDNSGADYRQPFTRDYFAAVNRYWLDELHVDGFRYDYVPGMYDGPVGQGYADLVYRTYEFSQRIPRFADEGFSRIIQCAEHLPAPVEVLSQTYTNCCWQNGLMDCAREMLRSGAVQERFAHLLDPELVGYPSSFSDSSAGVSFPVAPFQYLETHDHRRFLNELGTGVQRDVLGEPYGDRSRFFKTQPYAIALYTGKGIPMLWQGQELGENWGLPPGGLGRNLFERPVHWEYFYDPPGRALVGLYRTLGSLRTRMRALGSRGHFYYFSDPEHLRQGVIAYHRAAAAAGGAPAEDMLVALNFSDKDAKVSVEFPEAGVWVEQLRNESLDIEVGGNPTRTVTVPSNYGAIYVKKTAP